MSSEHGHSQSEETTFAHVIGSIFMALLLIPMILEKSEEVVQNLTAQDAAGHGGQH